MSSSTNLRDGGCLFNTNVLKVMTYGRKTWTLTKKEERTDRVMKRKILGSPHDHIGNQTLLQMSRWKTLSCPQRDGVHTWRKGESRLEEKRLKTSNLECCASFNKNESSSSLDGLGDYCWNLFVSVQLWRIGPLLRSWPLRSGCCKKLFFHGQQFNNL